MKQNVKRRGFTLMELIIVIAIITILAAIGIPSLFSFIETGRQINRMNIARTLYLTAQNQLTELRVTRGLEGAVTAEGIVSDDESTQVYILLGKPGDWPDKGNDADVHYISKPAGIAPSGLMLRLLNPVMEKSVLNDAILIEFNIKTGIVLSVFYGDRGGAGFAFSYDQAPAAASIFGPRGMDLYAPIAQRPDKRQGYYGVESTNGLPVELNPLIINIYDSFDDQTNPEGLPGDNILFAMISIPEECETDEFEASIPLSGGAALSTGTFTIDDLNENYMASPAFPNLYARSKIAQDGYFIVYWILDYVTGDTSALRNSIGNAFDPSSLITAGIADKTTGNSAQSSAKNPYFGAGSYGNRYVINTARHLYNIRYALTSAVAANSVPNGVYTQSETIDLDKPGSEISNFDPIPDFSGTYDGNTFNIENLKVGAAADKAGLFGDISSGGSVKNLCLVDPRISGGGPAGAVCGENYGMINNLVIDNPDVRGGAETGAVCGINNKTINDAYIKFFDAVIDDPDSNADRRITSDGGGAAGGIAGVNGASGEILNAAFLSPFPAVHIDGGSVGGITSSNSGVINGVLFLALAPQQGSDIVPVAPSTRGSAVRNAYYLAGRFIRPGPDDSSFDFNKVPAGRNEYNRDNNTGSGAPLTTWELYNALNSSGGYALPGWSTLPGINDEVNVDSSDGNTSFIGTVYPYPHYGSWADNDILASNPFWPIAGGGTSLADLEYYEYYGYGAGSADQRYVPYPDFGNSSLLENRVVIHDGYSIRMTLPDYDKTYTLTIGSDTYDIGFNITGDTFDVNLPGSDWRLDKNASDIPVQDTETWVRLYIPTDLQEGASLGAAIDISLYDGDTEIFTRTINPMFAPQQLVQQQQGVQTYPIRSPRQLDNIDASAGTRGANYVQLNDLDFSQYLKGLGASLKPERGVYKDFTSFGEPVVTGTFSGSYNGGKREVRNVVISAPGSDGIGLFATNSGTIYDIILTSPVITGRNNTGGIAGANSASRTIRNSQIDNAAIYGGNNTGGVAGTNAGTINTVTLNDSGISGSAGTGGVAGTNAGTINTVTLNNPTITGGDNTGGVAGANSGTVSASTLNYPTITGGGNTGGVAGGNTGTIGTATLNYPEIKGGDNTGGVAGDNSQTINTSVLNYPDISGGDNTGGVAGRNAKTISNTIRLQTPSVSGSNHVGGVAGLNTDTIGQGSGASGRGADISVIEPTVSGTTEVGGVAGTNNGVITDCRVYSNTVMGSATIQGSSYVGGIAGINPGKILYSWIGLMGKPLGDLRALPAPNTVLGDLNTGGVAGSSSGSINICYADFTRVGAGSSSGNIGGVAGELTGGSITNVFYNYGNAAPQIWNWAVTVRGVTSTTGGLVGSRTGGTLTNAYSDAYFGNMSNLLAGTSNTGWALPASVLYLKQPGYNTGTPNGGTPRTALDATTLDSLRNASAVGTTLLGSNSNQANWAMGTGATAGTPFAYPYLTAFTMPQWWPMPEKVDYYISYYELYESPNPNNSGLHYGIWDYGQDTLDYSPGQKVVEDGYVLLSIAGFPSNMSVWAVDVDYSGSGTIPANAYIQLNNGSTQGNATQFNVTAQIPALGNMRGVVLPIEQLERFAGIGTGKKGLYPVEIRVTSGGSVASNIQGYAYMNPFFAKSVFPNLTAARNFAPMESGYVIRSPRQLRNIGNDDKTLTGIYMQELDIDFDGLNTDTGYWMNNLVTTTPVPRLVNGKFVYGRPAAGKYNIDISRSVVYNPSPAAGYFANSSTNGLFTGDYDAGSHYLPDGTYENSYTWFTAIRNIGQNTNTQGQIKSASENTGVFSRIGIGGIVANLTLQNNQVTGVANTGGLAGSSDGSISNIVLDSNQIVGGANTGGLVGTNTGSVSNITANNLNVTGKGENVGGIIGYNKGSFDSIEGTNLGVYARDTAASVWYNNAGGVAGRSDTAITHAFIKGSTVEGASNTGGIAGYAGGDVVGSSTTKSKITGNGDNVGGIAGWADGNISDSASVDGVDIRGGIDVGGVAGNARGDITDCRAEDIIVTGTGNNTGGIAGAAQKSITNCTVTGKSNKVTGINAVGGIAGYAISDILNSNVSWISVSGEAEVGGIVGHAGSSVSGCSADNAKISGTGGSIGGIAGINETIVKLSSVTYSTITGADSVGGITGVNTGIVADVFFLSVNEPDSTPVRASGSGVAGGISGLNRGSVANAFYLAPAPFGAEGIYPIVGDGTPAALADDEEETCFFLQGWMPVQITVEEEGVDETGQPATVEVQVEDWLMYNIPDDGAAVLGGGAGYNTAMMHLDVLDLTGSISWDAWTQLDAGYPYPILTGASVPADWPVTLDQNPGIPLLATENDGDQPAEPSGDTPGAGGAGDQPAGLSGDPSFTEGADAQLVGLSDSAGAEEFKDPGDGLMQTATTATQVVGAVFAAPALAGALKKWVLRSRRGRRIDDHAVGAASAKRRLRRIVRSSRRR